MLPVTPRMIFKPTRSSFAGPVFLTPFFVSSVVPVSRRVGGFFIGGTRL